MKASYISRLTAFVPEKKALEDFINTGLGERLLKSFDHTITWLAVLQDVYGDKETSVLISSAHSKIIETWILVPLGLVHSAFACLRTAVDICTSYSFYYSHPLEWLAVCDKRAQWEGRASIIDWHIHYTLAFREFNAQFHLSERLNEDYQDLSSYVHGIPLQGLPTMPALEKNVPSRQEWELLINIAERVDYNLNLLFIGVFNDLTPIMSQNDYNVLIKGINKQKLAKSGIILPGV